MPAYEILVAISYIAGCVIVWAQARHDKRPTKEIVDVLTVMVLSALLGSKLFHAVFEAAGHELSTGQIASGFWDLFLDDPWHGFRLFDPGYVFWGGVIIATVVTYAYARIRHIPSPIAYGDYAVPALALGILLGRIGCYVTGCCYGKDNHPVQLYDAAFGLLILLLPRMRYFPFLLAYSVWRFLTEFFRNDVDRGIWIWGLSTSQIISILVAILLLSILFSHAVSKHQDS